MSTGEAHAAERSTLEAVSDWQGRNVRPHWFVANPSSTPELGHLASAAAACGRCVDYRLPLATIYGHDVWASRLRVVGQRKASRLADLAVRRRLHSDLAASSRTRYRASLLELMHAGLVEMSAGTTAVDAALDARNFAFDLRCAHDRRLPCDGIVVGLVTVCEKLFARANSSGSLTVLDYPIAHQDYIRSIYRQETTRFPKLAATLGTTTLLSPRHQQRIRKEVDRSDRIIALSQFHASTFVEAGISSTKLITAPLGVDTSIFTERPRVRVNQSPTIRLIFTGQITQRKGIAYLFEIYERLQGNFSLTMVGRPIGDALAHLPAYIDYKPHVSRPLLAELYRSSDIFVFPSLVEGFPQTPLEAMASGLPVVISNQCYGATGPVTDGVNGFVLDARDVSGFTDRINLLASDSELRASFGMRAAEDAKAYSWSAFGNRVIADAEGALRGRAFSRGNRVDGNGFVDERYKSS